MKISQYQNLSISNILLYLNFLESSFFFNSILFCVFLMHCYIVHLYVLLTVLKNCLLWSDFCL